MGKAIKVNDTENTDVLRKRIFRKIMEDAAKAPEGVRCKKHPEGYPSDQHHRCCSGDGILWYSKRSDFGNKIAKVDISEILDMKIKKDRKISRDGVDYQVHKILIGEITYYVWGRQKAK
jgi:hypothetical protein